jgi:8-oxo-dGTP pyrophosphatase MutT (NUDIX family)
MVKHEKSAGAIIFYVENDKVLYLLLKYPTYWGFAKGIIEKDESEEEAAKREAEEEAGLRDLKFIGGFKEKIGWFFRAEGELVRKEAVYLLAETKNKQIKISEEHEGYKWCEFEEAQKLQRIKQNKKMLEKADNFLKEHLKQKTLM